MIERIESFANRQLCIVKVTASDGAVGYGQTAPFEADITQFVLHRQVAPLALNQPEDDFSLADRLINNLHKFTGTYVCRAAAGIDTALWDLCGKRKNQSVARMIGGADHRKKISMYYSSMVRDCPVEWEKERMARMKAENGYSAFKLHVGVCNSDAGEDYWPGRTESMLKAASEVTQGKDDLYVDPNGAFGYSASIRLLPLMRSCGVTFLEEPLPFWKVEETARLRKDIHKQGLLMAGGEQDYNPNVWKLILDLPMADIIQPDIGYIGGFTRTLDIAAKAAKLGIFTTPHTSNRSMLLPFGLHLMAVIDKPWPYLEHGVEPDPWTDALYDQPLQVENGMIKLPEEPGWGIKVSDEWLKEAQYRETRVSNVE